MINCYDVILEYWSSTYLILINIYPIICIINSSYIVYQQFITWRQWWPMSTISDISKKYKNNNDQKKIMTKGGKFSHGPKPKYLGTLGK